MRARPNSVKIFWFMSHLCIYYFPLLLLGFLFPYFTFHYLNSFPLSFIILTLVALFHLFCFSFFVSFMLLPFFDCIVMAFPLLSFIYLFIFLFPLFPYCFFINMYIFFFLGGVQWTGQWWIGACRLRVSWGVVGKAWAGTCRVKASWSLPDGAHRVDVPGSAPGKGDSESTGRGPARFQLVVNARNSPPFFLNYFGHGNFRFIMRLKGTKPFF